jgi:hypothetical protein
MQERRRHHRQPALPVGNRAEHGVVIAEGRSLRWRIRQAEMKAHLVDERLRHIRTQSEQHQVAEPVQ